jgi:hypothetical protein
VSVSFNQLHQYDYSRFKQVLLPGREQAGPFARGTIRASTAAHTCTEHETASANGRNFGASGRHRRDRGFGRYIAKGGYREINDSDDGGVPAPRSLAGGAIGTKHNRKGHAAGIENRRILFLDRAMIFEDPTGIRILYDPGFTVAGSTDPRLGNIDVTLLSHAHADHIGTGKLNQNPDASTAVCSAAFPQMPTVPNSNLAEITAEKHAVFVGTPALAPFIGPKMQAVLNASRILRRSKQFTSSCWVPQGSSCIEVVNFGGTRTVERAGIAEVQIAVVPAIHDNGIPNSLLPNPLSTELASQGLTFQPAPPVGYVVTFTNGLTAYLSGDTGQTAEMKVMAEFYHPGLAVINIGDIFTTGPRTRPRP